MLKLTFTSNIETIKTYTNQKYKFLLNKIPPLVGRWGEKVFQRTYDLAPKDTFFMVEHLVLNFTSGGYNFVVGWYRDDFLSQGKRFYPPYVEYGTSRTPAQPSLGPAYRENRPIFKSQLTQLIMREMSKQNKAKSK